MPLSILMISASNVARNITMVNRTTIFSIYCDRPFLLWAASLIFCTNFALEIIIAATARQWKIFSLAYWHYKGAGPCSDDMRWPPCEVSWCKAVDGRRRGSHRHHSGYPVLRPLWLNPKPAVGAGNPTKWCKPLDYIDMCNISTILLLYIYDIISTIEMKNWK